MKESKIMKKIHKVREKMAKMNRDEFKKSLIKARNEYKKLIE